jgi:hypothetical protein
MNPYLIIPIFKWDLNQFLSIEGGVFFQNCGVVVTNYDQTTLELKNPSLVSQEVDFYLNQLKTVEKDGADYTGHLYQDQPAIDVSFAILNGINSPNLQSTAYDYLKVFDASLILDPTAGEAVQQLMYAIKAQGYN